MRLTKEKISDINFLELTPVRNFEHVIEETGLVSVLVPKFSQKVLAKVINPIIKTPFFKAKLDEIGSETWLEINGEKNVEAITKQLEIKFGEKINPSVERITKFLSNLHNNNFISFKELKKGE
jgi:hypothetical protein